MLSILSKAADALDHTVNIGQTAIEAWKDLNAAQCAVLQFAV
jgi:hypothetical protein